jgi:integrase
VLTASRTSETIGATWDEIDLEAGVWTVPASRIKAGKEHRVPLSDRAVAILTAQAAVREGPYLFVGDKPGAGLSNMAMLAALHRMGRDGLTVHGFRSTFRDWAAERTNYPNHVCEAALAHVVDNKAEAAYRRGDLFQKRRRLMQAWADYAGRPMSAAGNVSPLKRSRAK